MRCAMVRLIAAAWSAAAVPPAWADRATRPRAQHLPERVIGRVCRDFDATALIWEFFRAHPKP